MATAQDNLARKQIFIPASQPEAVVLRVAAYCRVSTDSEDQLNSFAAQQSYYNDYIRKHDNWQLAEIYADEGITGTSAKKRKDFQRLLADCRNGRIDKVLVKSISRSREIPPSVWKLSGNSNPLGSASSSRNITLIPRWCPARC